jgi:hypothetical protein
MCALCAHNTVRCELRTTDYKFSVCRIMVTVCEMSLLSKTTEFGIGRPSCENAIVSSPAAYEVAQLLIRLLQL